MERARKQVNLHDGRSLTVEESTWESAARRSAIEERARRERAQANGSADPVLFYFLENYYSFLASCTLGEIPEAKEALELPAEDLDSWFNSIVEVNPESFLELDRWASSEVEFRDGSRFRILSAYLPSVTLRRIRLEEEALSREEDRNNPKDIFSVYLYPILAACSIGEIPDPETIRREWPESQIYKWRDAVKEVNPQWFMTSEEIEEKTLQKTEEEQKKSSRSRRRSPGS
jgi:hypothetical protein